MILLSVLVFWINLSSFGTNCIFFPRLFFKILLLTDCDRTGECIHTAQFNHGVSCLSLRESEKDDYIYIAKTNGEVSSWNVETQQEISTQQITNGLIEGLQVIDDLIIASDNNRMIVKDFSSNGAYY